MAIFYVLALVYFGLSGRNRLVLSPEEEFALTRGVHGHPETEGYGTTRVSDIPADRAWDDFFAAPGIDMGDRDQPPGQERELL